MKTDNEYLLEKSFIRLKVLTAIASLAIFAVAIIAELHAADNIPKHPSTAPSGDLISLQQQLTQAQDDLRTMETRAYQQVADLASAERALGDARNASGKDKGMFAARTNKFLESERQRLGNDSARETYDELAYTAHELTRATQFQDPRTKAQWKKIWDFATGFRQKILEDARRIPPSSRPSDDELSDPEKLWQFYSSTVIQQNESELKQQQLLIHKLQAPAFVTDWAIKTGTTEAQEEFCEAYLGAITPPELLKARDKVHILTIAVWNAQTRAATRNAATRIN